MLILGIDFETTGLNVEKDRIIEIGAVLWDTDGNIPIKLYSSFTWDADYPALSELIVKKTGITQEMLHQHGLIPCTAFKEFSLMLQQAEAVVAHNGNRFDYLIWQAEASRAGIESRLDQLIKIDTRTDVPYPPEITAQKLTYLAAEHGFLNPFAHRAVFDVLTMLTILSRYPIEEVIKRSQEPTILLAAVLPYEERDRAKARGYHWHAPSVQWMKRFRYSEVEQEEKECGFLVLRIDDDGRDI